MKNRINKKKEAYRLRKKTRKEEKSVRAMMDNPIMVRIIRRYIELKYFK